MGLKDMYPFVLSQPAIEKLRFVHRVCTEPAPALPVPVEGLEPVDAAPSPDAAA